MRRLHASALTVLQFMLALLVANRSVDGEWFGAGLGLAAFLAVLTRWPVVVLALALAVLTDQLFLAALVAVGLAIQLAPEILPVRWFTLPFDPGTLARCVRSLPPGLVAGLHAGASPISTLLLVRAACRDDPARWQLLGEAEPQVREEGPLIDAASAGAGWTQAAAESAALAVQLKTELSLPLDVHLLAGAAVWVPGSVAATWAGSEAAKVPESVLGIYSAAFVRAVARFSNSPEGGDLSRRWQILGRIGAEADQLHPDWVFARTGPDAAALRKHSRRQGLAEAGPIVMLLSATVWLARDWLRDRRAGKAAGPSSDRRPEPPARPTPSPSLPAPRRQRTPRVRAGYRDVYRWTAGHRLLWHGLRPLATVFVPLAAAATGESGVGIALVATGGALVRPVRRGSGHVVLAATLTIISWPAALAAAGRGLVTEATLLGLGAQSGTSHSWRAHRRAGIDRVVEARRRLVSRLLDEPGLLAAAPAGLDQAGVCDAEDDVDTVVRYLAWTWSTASLPALARALQLSIRGLVFGRWPGSPRVFLWADVGRAAALLALMTGLVRVLGITVAATVAATRYPLGGIELGPLAVGGGLVAGAVTALATLVLTRAGRSPRLGELLVRSTGAAGIAFVFGRDQLPAILGIAAVAGTLTLSARSLADHLFLTGFTTGPPVPVPRWRPGFRRSWVAAARTESDGRLGLSVRLFDDLSSSIASTDLSLAAAAKGRAGEVRLRRGELQAVAEAAHNITELLDRASLCRGVATSIALISRARLRAELGDWAGAEADLRDASQRLPRWSAARTEAALLLADVLARLGRPDDAAAALLPVRPTLVLRGGLDRLIDSEVAIAAGYYAAGATATGRSRLREALDLLANGVEAFHLGRRTVDRAAQAYGRGQLLLGRIELSDGNPESAAQALSLAAAQLRSPRSQGVAIVLRGVAAIHLGETGPGVDAVRNGLRALEAGRGQLVSGDQRAQVIIAEEEVYDSALAALAIAQAAGDAAAGDVAAECIESLRRSALAALLRSGGLELPAEAKALLEDVARLERSTAVPPSEWEPQKDDPVPATKRTEELRALRERIAITVSDRFADAYLPQAVDVGALRRRARDGDVLSYYLPEGRLPGWVVWMRPGISPVLRRVATDDVQILRLIEALAEDTGLVPVPFRSPHVAALRDPMDETSDLWRTATEVLVPSQLCAELDQRVDGSPVPLVVVPDGMLALFPWGALRTPRGRLVVDVTVPQVVPTLELLVPAAGPPKSPIVLAHLDSNMSGSELEGAALAALGATLAGSLDEFVTTMAAGQPDIVYLAAHGKGDGLDQTIAFGGGEALSAAEALAHRWAPTSIFASCFVGRYAQRAGREPLGIAVACLLGGARSIVGGVVAVSTAASPEVCTAVVAAVCAGGHAAVALRDAQRSYLAQHDLASVHDCLGFVCISTLEPSAARTTADGGGTSV